ncbi:MAG: hypothetical protein IKK39_08285 [Thermoguttaceae bacterium]|nr:hypothetical protein [Thermoguttaceae bacterium]
MKRTDATLIFATLSIVVFAATVACTPASDSRRGDALTLSPVGSSGDVATQTFEPQDLATNPLRATFALYPTELAFGDAAYYTLDVENVSDSAAYFDEDAADRALNESTLSRCVARVATTVDGVPGEYVAAPELATLFVRAPSEEPQPSTLQPINDVTSSGMRGSVDGLRLKPGVKTRRVASALEFPPLEDWNDPFWTAVRDKLSTQASVELQLRFELRLPPKVSGARKTPILQPQASDAPTLSVEKTLVLKRRDDNELATVDRWFETTPPDAFPVCSDDGTWKGPRFYRRDEGPQPTFISLDGASYRADAFTRIGARKPTLVDAPTTVDGWRRLEAEFAPSTLRDEITLTRLQLEYYDAPEGEESDAALEALVDWFKTRPEPQRAAWLFSLKLRALHFFKKPLEAKRATLYKKLTSAFKNATESGDDAE